jgi:hypothetical protein
MEYQQIKEALAPCGLSCEKCFAHANGEIRSLSIKLQEALGNFGVYAKRFETLMDAPIFKKYPDFKLMLDYLAAENCKGCRNEQCRLFKECGVRSCHQEKQVDFCYQCEAFPCNHTQFDEQLYKTWVLVNEKIKKMGLEEYYEKTRLRPRYV